MKVLIKLGGTLLDSAASRNALSCQIADAAERGLEIVVVHGGGKQMTRFLGERGVKSRFVNGLRVTTPETLDAVVKVVAGSVNRELVASLARAGARAVGICGIDGGLVETEQMDPELGAVGRVLSCNADLLYLLTENEYIPVVACVGGDSRGNLYNVNADQMAVACAAGFGADLLIFLTDVEGVLDGNGKVRHALCAAEGERLVSSGVATGGMQAKLNAAVSALRQRVGQVRIVGGAAEDVIGRVLAGESLGTRLGL